ncbi:MAG: hypothetical protein LWW94_00665 [Candidatus Desulfofervidaceae bacterium]|nr:hypothetical protein [Candidatus Desulfofervidaceae bacterium]
MLVGRKLGWFFSKRLYTTSFTSIVIFGLIWGIVVAVIVRSFIIWQKPSLIVRWIMGFALGAYVSIPNFGLMNEDNISDEIIREHVLLKTIPEVTYIIGSIILAYFVKI